MNQDVNEMLNNFFLEKESYLKSKKETQKEKDLISWGFSKMDYSDTCKEDYYYSSLVNKFVKKIALDISDEDYEKIKKYKLASKNNGMERIANIIAIGIFIIGFISGIVLGAVADSFIATLVIWATTFAFGFLYIILAHIIKMLNYIKENM